MCPRGSIDQLERELYLAGVAGGLADLAEAGTGENVGGQAHGDDVEEVPPATWMGMEKKSAALLTPWPK